MTPILQDRFNPVLISVALVTLLPLIHACAATNQHFVRGTVIELDESMIAIRHKSGQVFRTSLADTTRYRRDHQAVSRDDVSVGARVQVSFDGSQKRPPLAREVQIFTRLQ